ncbi:hypothetical protein AAHA92_10675 [Salvia divinorum]|uniref:Uncharacterized protein n=1 Tax=Salvia divinorum TaxID=28513 RepID=A0ABD1HYY6_SALDI
MIDTRSSGVADNAKQGAEDITNVAAGVQAEEVGMKKPVSLNSLYSVAARKKANKTTKAGTNTTECNVPTEKGVQKDVDNETTAMKGMSGNMATKLSACDKEGVGTEPSGRSVGGLKSGGKDLFGTKHPREDLGDPVEIPSTKENNECTKTADDKGKSKVIGKKVKGKEKVVHKKGKQASVINEESRNIGKNAQTSNNIPASEQLNEDQDTEDLHDAQQNWKKRKVSPFTGPISFLVAFYVDLVFHKTLLVSRVFPTVAGWTSTISGKDNHKEPSEVAILSVCNTQHVALTTSLPPVSSFTTIGMSDYPDNEQAMVSVSCSARQVTGTKNEIYVEEIVKSVVDAYMECGDVVDDDDDELSLSSWMNKSVIPVGNIKEIRKIDKDNEIDVEAIVKSAVDAYMECDDNDDDFVTPLRNDDMENWKMKVRSKAEMKITNALRSPFYERPVKVSNKLNPDERIMFYWLMTTYNTNEEKLVYDDDVVEVRVIEFISLLPHSQISSGIVNAWCSVLNNMEDLRAPSSPKRLFFTTYPAVSEHKFSIMTRI